MKENRDIRWAMFTKLIEFSGSDASMLGFCNNLIILVQQE